MEGTLVILTESNVWIPSSWFFRRLPSCTLCLDFNKVWKQKISSYVLKYSALMLLTIDFDLNIGDPMCTKA